MFLGHLGRDALAAAAVGITYYHMVLFFTYGMCTALDTYASQAYGQNDEGASFMACVVAHTTAVVASQLLKCGGFCRRNYVLDVGGICCTHNFVVPNGSH